MGVVVADLQGTWRLAEEDSKGQRRVCAASGGSASAYANMQTVPGWVSFSLRKKLRM
jgi:hypothetical protein